MKAYIEMFMVKNYVLETMLYGIKILHISNAEFIVKSMMITDRKISLWKSLIVKKNVVIHYKFNLKLKTI